MTNSNQEKVLRFVLERAGNVTIKVKGYSMFPELSEGDKISLHKLQNYNIGDVLVYNYNGEGLLVHRLLEINEFFVCKGDYAFRLEKINQSEVIGKVTLINGQKIKQWDTWKSHLSYEIGKMYSQFNNIEKVKNTSLYKLYYALVLKGQPDPIVFCSETYDSFLLNCNHLSYKCSLTDAYMEEYRDIDSTIIFSALPKLPIRSFLNRLYSFYPDIDQDLNNKILTRLCKLIQKQVITVQ